MKFSIATASAAIFLAHSANAWVFTWRDFTGIAHIIDGGNDNKACTSISHAKGQLFEWDRGNFINGLLHGCCISLYSNSVCSGDPQGYSCDNWTKAASLDLNSFKVMNC